MGADNELFIYLRMVAAQAEQTSKAYHQGERARIKKTADVQDDTEKQYVKAIKLRERAGRDLLNSMLKAEKDFAAKQQQLLKEVAALQSKLGKQEVSDQKTVDKAISDSKRTRHAESLRNFRSELQAARESAAEQAKAQRTAKDAIIKRSKEAAATEIKNARETASAAIASHRTMVSETAKMSAMRSREEITLARITAKERAAIWREETTAFKVQQAEMAAFTKPGSRVKFALDHGTAAEEIRDARVVGSERQKQAMASLREQALQRRAYFEGHAEWLKGSQAKTQAMRARLGLGKAITSGVADEATALGSAAMAAGSYIAGFATFAVVVSGLKAASDYFKAIRADTIDSVKEMLHFREAVLELAAMKDKLGDSTGEAVAQMEFRSKTAQTQQSALALSQHFQGAAQASIGVNISEKAAEAGKVTAGKIQAMEGSAASGIGALAANYAIEAHNPTEKEFGSTVAAGYKISQPGKFINAAQFAEQRRQLTPLVQTGLLKGREADVFVSAMSEYSKTPQEAGTLAEWALRAGSVDTMRNRKMKLLPGMEGMSSATLMKSLKIDDQMPPLQRVLAVGAHINKLKAEAKAKGKEFFANDFFNTHGVINQESQKGYMATAGLLETGQWDKTFAPLLSKEFDPAEIDKAHTDFTTRDPAGKALMAGLSRDSSKYKRAAGPEGVVQALQEQEFSRLLGEKKISGTFEEWQKSGTWENVSNNLLFNNWHGQVNEAVQGRLTDAAAKSGIDVGDINQGRNIFGGKTSMHHAASEAQLADIEQKLEKAGINVLDGAKTMMEAAKMNKETAEKSRPAVPAPMPGPGKFDPRVGLVLPF